jgi:hypothetical protein
MKQKQTKQGVRDLNSLPGKKRLRPEMPASFLCKHKRIVEALRGDGEECFDCGEVFDRYSRRA